LVAGFFVNWDDNSFVSLKAHAGQLDWVVCEWLFLAQGGDSLRTRVDRRVLYLTQHLPVTARPSVLAMLTNYDTARADFDPALLRRLVTVPAHRAAVIGQAVTVVRTYGLAGVTVDFEEIPASLHPQVAQFVRELSAALHALGAVVAQAVSADIERAPLSAYADAVDRIFLMLYDEHDGRGDAGPVASQRWYIESAQRLLGIIPPEKAILAVGAYGYDWNDAQPHEAGDERTFQDVMRSARTHGATVHFDSLALNPYLTWTDPDSTDHVVWFLDAVTAYNQVMASRTLGAGGIAVWRLGAEDPSLWRVLRRGGVVPAPDSLGTIQSGYDVEFDGSGELLRVESRPTTGRRDLRVDHASGLIVDERVTAYPSPYVVARTGASPHRVALTFDDGPDDHWTPMILDTLRAYHAPATFFVIGQNVERNIALTRRIAREGHELGNHTFRHPNLALTSALVTRLELDATERILEAVLNRRTGFFRPPYFGDAEPTTADELVPVGIATDLGYSTAGLHVDSDDWQQPGVERIVHNVIDGRRRALACLDSLHQKREEDTPLENGCSGSIALLHDGGGDRAQTVAALGPLIDSLRAAGDTVVLLSTLAGLTHAQAMPPLPPSSAGVRYAELATFGALGLLEWLLSWLFLLAVVLGIGRLVVITLLAVLQRFGRFRASHQRAPPDWHPPVSVVVPAYNEALVINKTIESLLAQEYPGPLQIIVVDDGSPDNTYAVAQEAFGTHPDVSIVRKANGGKASALNVGISEAKGEIVIGLDADTLFPPGTIARLITPLADPRVGAVSGNAKVGNRTNLVTRWQALEYVTSQNLDRRAFSLLNCITVVPGAIGAWRTALVREVGGFSDDTLAEDQDLTLAIRRRGYTIAFADGAIALTEAPDTFAGLAKQRFRWSFGTLQCMWKHRDALLRPRYGTLGFIAMPNVWLFQLLFTAVSPLADLLALWSLFSVWLVRQEHGATYALTNLEQVLTLYAVFLLVDWGAAVVAFLLEPGEERRLTWLIFLQRFAYRQIMYWVVVRSFVAAVRGHVVGWGKLERKGTVDMAASPDAPRGGVQGAAGA
jgi:cellulose synthase/poly-beta-1,6-N-acetylglucosamine synthase-like glycosyltransferase/peptidoglycan/xylan/chitin deacetylase (PgdA/CDA1 family)/spore germination protein YaaH